MYTASTTAEGDPCALYVGRASHMWHTQLSEIQHWCAECCMPIRISRVDRMLIFQNHNDLSWFIMRWNQ